MSFLIYTLILVLLGIFIRIFWLQIAFVLLVVSNILLIIGVSAITAGILVFIQALITVDDWSGFLNYFKYSLTFFSVAAVVRMFIVSDIVTMVLRFFRK